MQRYWSVAAGALALALGLAPQAQGNEVLEVYNQGFESDTAGWTDGGARGEITRVSSGENGINSASGLHHAEVEGGGSGDSNTVSAPFTYFDQSRSYWPGKPSDPDSGFTASLDVYLNTGWSEGTGFDYSVAAWGTDGTHQRDFIFHVAKDSGDLLVGASNNSSFETKENLESGMSHTVNSSGWYTLQQDFYNDGGQLAVDMNLLNNSGSNVFTKTLSNAGDTIPGEVGGNGYGWFTFVDDSNGEDTVAIDNANLTVAPVPGAVSGGVALLALTSGGALLRRRRQSAE
jgi:hypothetical protein